MNVSSKIQFGTWDNSNAPIEGEIRTAGNKIVVFLAGRETATGTIRDRADAEPWLEWDDCPDGPYLDDAEASIRLDIASNRERQAGRWQGSVVPY